MSKVVISLFISQMPNNSLQVQALVGRTDQNVNNLSGRNAYVDRSNPF